jgi:alkylated DNA nucleotide flippase Atl1
VDSAEWVESVLDLVETIPPGRVMTYGDVAAHVGVPSPRQVGQVLARRGHEVPWQRVVMADGGLVPHARADHLARLRAEGTALRGTRVDLDRARWAPRAARPARKADRPGGPGQGRA